MTDLLRIKGNSTNSKANGKKPSGDPNKVGFGSYGGKAATERHHLCCSCAKNLPVMARLVTTALRKAGL